MSMIVYIAEKPRTCWDCPFIDDEKDATYCALTSHKFFMDPCPLPVVDDSTADLLIETMMDGGFNARVF